jgi:microcompartment protein CcmL/EutN
MIGGLTVKNGAMGFIETFGYGTAIAAADAALKAAVVHIIRIEPTIGSGGSLGVTIFLKGEVAAVKAAVEAGNEAAGRIGKVVSVNVIPNMDSKVYCGMYHGNLSENTEM